MTSRNISKKYFIGKSATNGKWASVYTYKPNNDALKDIRGHIFATIALNGPETFATATAGNMILDYFHETYFEHPAEKTLDALEKSVIATSKHLQLLMKHDDKVKEGVEMDLNAMVIKGDIVYFVNMGASRIFIFRDGELTNISDNLKDPIGSGIVKLGSMVSKPADILVLGTPRLLEEIDEKELKQIVADYSETELKQKKYKDDSDLAMIMVGIDVDRKENKEELAIRDKIKEEVEKKIDEISANPENEEVIASEDDDKTLEDMINEDQSDDFMDNAELETNVAEELDDTSDQEFSETRINDEEDDLGEEDEELEDKQPVTEKVGEVFNKLKSSVQDFIAKRKGAGASPMMPTREQVVAAKAAERAPQISPEDQTTYKVILDKVRLFFVNAGVFLKKNVWHNMLGMGGDDVYVLGSGQRKKRNIRFIIVLVVVVIGILYFSITNIQNNLKQKEADREAESTISAAEELILDVEQIAPIKAKASSSDLGKQELYDKLNEAEAKLAEVDSDEYDEQIDGFLNQIEDLRDILNRTISVENPTEVVDFGQSYPGADTVDMVLGNGNVYVADKQYGKIYQVDYAGNSPSVLVEGLEQPKTITLDDNGDIVFIDENGDKRMGTISTSDGSIIRHSGTSEFRVGNISAIEFSDIFGGRVYGIDQSQNKVIVLQRSGTAYGIPQNRFELAQLSNAPDIHVIDLKIYVLADINQGIYRFYNEQDDSPLITGIESGENLYDATAIYIDGLYIYVADPVNQRVMVFTKASSEIDLVAQYKYRGSDSDGFKNIKEIQADREAGKLFVLDGTKVYELDLSALNSI
ncbi:hypothetical protein KC909_02650 [Candidatus Dojkabacteria bacterium]|uniref:PPM-type phosphatase domain-containing protein n=1 Tax=Candidatus Dojkabacteria bacterium TaxID=2099670 RepID=A0A955L581_9BACT|nr:hypothetical protein [Candidatus Dojkabacteria bacterium]